MLINAAAVVGTVIIARRRGGVGLAVAVALGLVLVTGSLAREAPYSIWNPYAALYPFTLLLFVAWSVACGELALCRCWPSSRRSRFRVTFRTSCRRSAQCSSLRPARGCR